MAIDRDKVEHVFDELKRFLTSARGLDLPHLEALTERMRVELMVTTPRRERRRVYRAVIDLLEEELEHRYDKQGADRAAVRPHVVRYFKRLIAGMDEDGEK